MSEKRRKFDQEFREGAVRIVRETGIPIAQVVVISESTRARWVTGLPRIVRSRRTPTAFRWRTSPS